MEPTYEPTHEIRWTYRGATALSVTLMVAGWIWHLYSSDETNPLITIGIALLLLTPVFALLHLTQITWHRDRNVAFCALIVIALMALAYGAGKL
ncbi:MAG: hypothetical protein KIT45_13445 [Fimbriimonadia bacterium]|nr:hypothetical protein [Fimbriimonadia bacterium]